MAAHTPGVGGERTVMVACGECENLYSKVVPCARELRRVGDGFFVFEHELDGPNQGERRQLSFSHSADTIQGSWFRWTGLRVPMWKLRAPEARL